MELAELRLEHHPIDQAGQPHQRVPRIDLLAKYYLARALSRAQEDFGTAAEVLLVTASELAVIVSGLVVLMLGNRPAPHKENCGPRGQPGAAKSRE